MIKEIAECSLKYWEDVRQLRNDPRVKDGFIQQEWISPSEHHRHMQWKWDQYRVCLIDGEFAGYIRVFNNDIGVCVKPEFQGMGVGKFMVKSAVEENPKAFAKVKIENEASLRLFESLGFKKKFYILEQEHE